MGDAGLGVGDLVAAMPDGRARRHFRQVGNGGALADFHLFMTILNSDGRRAIRFVPPCCAHVGDDEAVLLAALAAASRGDFEDMRATIGLLIEPPAASVAREALERFADHIILSPLVQLARPSAFSGSAPI